MTRRTFRILLCLLGSLLVALTLTLSALTVSGLQERMDAINSFVDSVEPGIRGVPEFEAVRFSGDTSFGGTIYISGHVASDEILQRLKMHSSLQNPPRNVVWRVKVVED